MSRFVNIKFCILVICLFLSNCIRSQIPVIHNGVSLSWTNHGNKKNISYIGSVGVILFAKERIMLNADLSLLERGEDTQMNYLGENRFKVKIDYISITPTVRYKRQLFMGQIYIGIGPSFDIKTKSRYSVYGEIDCIPEKEGVFFSKDIVFGAKAETGCLFYKDKFLIDINIGYRSNLSKIIPDTRRGFISSLIEFKIGVGYLL